MRQPHTKKLKNVIHYAVEWEDQTYGWNFVSIKYLRNLKGAMAESYAAGEEIIYKTGKKEYPGKILSKEDVDVPERKPKKSTGKENSKKAEKTKKNPPKKPTTQAEVSPTKESFNDARFKKFMKCLNAVFEKYQLQDIAIDTVTLDFQSSYPEYDDNEIADYLLEMEERNQLMITDTRIYKISS